MTFESALTEKKKKDSEEEKKPKLQVDKGDMILTGKFKNKKAEVEGFGKDDNNQPIVKTNKGDKKMHSFRINKLLPKDKRKEED